MDLASIALLFTGAVTPNLLGEVFVAIQAIAVGAFAELQYIGLRRSGATRWQPGKAEAVRLARYRSGPRDPASTDAAAPSAA